MRTGHDGSIGSRLCWHHACENGFQRILSFVGVTGWSASRHNHGHSSPEIHTKSDYMLDVTWSSKFSWVTWTMWREQSLTARLHINSRLDHHVPFLDDWDTAGRSGAVYRGPRCLRPLTHRQTDNENLVCIIVGVNVGSVEIHLSIVLFTWLWSSRVSRKRHAFIFLVSDWKLAF